MNDFLIQLRGEVAAGSVLSFWEMLIALSLSFVLGLVIVLVYRRTHWGTSYSQSFTQSLIIMGCVVAAIMLIIGSNIARAFSLVGALSIIRYRNAVKDSRDTAFVFLVMGVGMACGTGLYMMAMLLTAFVCGGILALNATDFGKKKITDQLLRLRLPSSVEYDNELPKLLKTHVDHAELISVDTIQKGEIFELVYRVRLKSSASEKVLIDDLLKINSGNPVTLVHRDQQIDI